VYIHQADARSAVPRAASDKTRARNGLRQELIEDRNNGLLAKGTQLMNNEQQVVA
jgi:hypothetical protein